MEEKLLILVRKIYTLFILYLDEEQKDIGLVVKEIDSIWEKIKKKIQ